MARLRPPGARLALVGSGEFTSRIAELDRVLVRPGGRVVALQASVPDGRDVQISWAERTHHGLNVDPEARVVRSLDDPEVVDLLESAGLIWLSGGDPLWLRDVLVPIRDGLSALLVNGTKLAGSSAGAMVLAERTLPRLDDRPRWEPALGFVGGWGVIPHLDVQPEDRLAEMLATAPADLLVMGIEESTYVILGAGRFEIGGPGRVRVYRAGAAVADLEPTPALDDVVDDLPDGHGPIGMLSGDEFGPGAEDFDRALLEATGPRVALMLAAQPAAVAQSARLAVDHFGRLGASPVVLDVLEREHALHPDLPDFDVLYMGGGCPATLRACLHATPLWDEIVRRWSSGAGLAGSSAGAMVLCRLMLVPRPGENRPTLWSSGLGPLSRFAPAVHATTRPPEWLLSVAGTSPVPVVALDDHAGLLLRPGMRPEIVGDGDAWVVTPDPGWLGD